MVNFEDFDKNIDLIIQVIESGTALDIVKMMIMIQIKMAYIDGVMETINHDVRSDKLQ